MDFKFRTKVLILLLKITAAVSGSVVQQLDVKWDNQKVCALRETPVKLTCSYSEIDIKTGFWFSPKQKVQWRNEDRPEDLALDFNYAGRVIYTEMTNFSSTLTITDVREGDAGDYLLLLVTEKGERFLSSPAVTLSVTGLQVTVDQTNRALNCSTSCFLKLNKQHYNWYKNGQYQKYHEENQFYIKYDEASGYSCSAHGYNDVLAPPVCFGANCFNVIYRDGRVCVLEGSSVDISGSYFYPSSYIFDSAFWFYVRPESPKDLRTERQFANRAEYVEEETRNSTLKLKHLTKEDSGEYRLRFIIGYSKLPFSGRPGVILNVTDLQVRARHITVASEEPTVVTLTCSSTCTLSDQPIYIWYRNGQPVTNKPTKYNKLYLDCSKDSGNYSCAVGGREDFRSPEETVESCAPVRQWSWFWYIAVGLTVFLVLLIIAGVLWNRRRKLSSDEGQSSTGNQDPQTLKDDVQYSSVQFLPSRTQNKPLTTVAKSQDRLLYAVVNFSRSTTAPLVEASRHAAR